MADRSNVSGLGMVVVAVLSTGVILASYHLIHRCLESNLKLDTTVARADQQRQSGIKKKKVRFADDVIVPDTSSEGDEYHRRRLRRVTAAAGGKLVRPALRKTAYSSAHLAC